MQYPGVHRPNPEETSITDIIAFRQHMLSLGLGVPVHRCPKCGIVIQNKPIKSFTLNGILDDTGTFGQAEDITHSRNSRIASPAIVDWSKGSVEVAWAAYGYE